MPYVAKSYAIRNFHSAAECRKLSSVNIVRSNVDSRSLDLKGRGNSLAGGSSERIVAAREIAVRQFQRRKHHSARVNRCAASDENTRRVHKEHRIFARLRQCPENLRNIAARHAVQKRAACRVERHTFACHNAERAPVDDGRGGRRKGCPACGIINKTCHSSAVNQCAARRHRPNALRQRQADGRRQRRLFEKLAFRHKDSLLSIILEALCQHHVPILVALTPEQIRTNVVDDFRVLHAERQAQLVVGVAVAKPHRAEGLAAERQAVVVVVERPVVSEHHKAGMGDELRRENLEAADDARVRADGALVEAAHGVKAARADLLGGHDVVVRILPVEAQPDKPIALRPVLVGRAAFPEEEVFVAPRRRLPPVVRLPPRFVATPRLYVNA